MTCYILKQWELPSFAREGPGETEAKTNPSLKGVAAEGVAPASPADGAAVAVAATDGAAAEVSENQKVPIDSSPATLSDSQSEPHEYQSDSETASPLGTKDEATLVQAAPAARDGEVAAPAPEAAPAETSPVLAEASTPPSAGAGITEKLDEIKAPQSN